MSTLNPDSRKKLLGRKRRRWTLAKGNVARPVGLDGLTILRWVAVTSFSWKKEC